MFLLRPLAIARGSFLAHEAWANLQRYQRMRRQPDWPVMRYSVAVLHS